MRSKLFFVVVVVVCVLLLANIASAELIQGINMDFVPIGNAGNGTDPDTGNLYGAVSYNYAIGKYEVTNGQWNAFVSAAGTPTGNPITAYNRSASWIGANIPTNKVSWYEAAQFCNYLTTRDKSLGAYQFNGNNTNPADFLGIDRDLAISAYGTAYVIPTEDEWYKAAYYTGSGYSPYANGMDTIPDADNGWNYSGGAYDSPWDVGTGTMEQNGTFDMMGNVFEWNETSIGSCSFHGFRGGTYDNFDYDLSSSFRSDISPEFASAYIGFRVASVPEPTTLLLLGLGGLFLRRRK